MLEGEQGKLAKAVAIGAGGLIAGIVILFAGYGIGLSSGYYEAEQQGYTAQQPSETDQRIKNCFVEGHSPDSARKCVEEAVQASRENSRGEKDLSAQRKMADWAWWLMILTFTGVPISIIGVLLLLRSVGQGRESLDQAKKSGEDQARSMERSVKEAAKSAAAMERVAASMAKSTDQLIDSIAISKRLADQQRTYAEGQMRAYISVLIGTAIYQDDFNNFEAHVLIKNTGQTPAKRLRWRISVGVQPAPIPDDFRYRLSEKIFSNNIIYPQQEGIMSAFLTERVEDDVAAIKKGFGKSLYVWGALSYQDVFGKTHRCTFAQQLIWRQSGEMREDGRIPEEVRGFFLPDHNSAN